MKDETFEIGKRNEDKISHLAIERGLFFVKYSRNGIEQDFIFHVIIRTLYIFQ